MVRSLALLLALLIWTAPLAAQQPPDPRIQDVISRQLDAFNRDDRAGAFVHASPMIQGMFGDAGTFMSMVGNGYPQIYRSRSHKFLKLDTADGKLVQIVLIEGADGSFVTAAYDMVEISGAWRINGCSLIKGEEA